ncbi:MAG: hypothetical protein R3F37_16235 [Candidatus Competibacteraceae bacterium]
MSSRIVWQECAAGDPDAAGKRLAALEGLTLLAVTEKIVSLAEELIIANILPPPPTMRYTSRRPPCTGSISFSPRHIANLIIQEKIAALFENKGLLLPVICTPEELLGAEYDE